MQSNRRRSSIIFLNVKSFTVKENMNCKFVIVVYTLIRPKFGHFYIGQTGNKHRIVITTVVIMTNFIILYIRLTVITNYYEKKRENIIIPMLHPGLNARKYRYKHAKYYK